jgi:hypothetical protein
MKTLTLLVVLLLVPPVSAQRKEQKPDVHADFQFGTYPLSRPAVEAMSSEQARLLMVAYAQGWQVDKLVKTYKQLSVPEMNKVSDRLEDERLLRRDEYSDLRPAMPIIRERDFERMKDDLQKHTQEFSRLLQGRWSDIETLVTGLEGSKTLPRPQAMYETVVSGILLGGMIDAFFEDKTLMPPPPRRGKNGNDRYFAWLVESNPAAAGKLKRELRDSDNYRIISIGTELPEERLDVGDLRGKATVYDEADALKYRRFIAVFCRDVLLPYFKSRRAEFLAQGAKMSSGKYVAAAEVFAWYYISMANGVADELVAARRITPPAKSYTYAVRVPQG